MANKKMVLGQIGQKLIRQMTLAEYSTYCCSGKLPASIQALRAKSQFLDDLIDIIDALGYLEPACVDRPDACEPEIVVTRSISVPHVDTDNPLNDDGEVIPMEARVISICAPLNKALMVKELEISPDNQTAEGQPHTQPVYKRVNIAGFGEWCMPFEPLDEAGLFVNVQNLLVPPKGGFSVYVQNYDTVSPALYKLRARMWACC